MRRLRNYLASELRKLSVADKVHAIVAALAILTTLLLVMAVQSVRLQAAHRSEFATAATAALNVERVNSLIYAIVMESRGIYMFTDPARVKVFADAVVARNHELAKVVEEWQHTVRDDDAEQFASFQKRIDQFIDFRVELVRRSVEISSAAGREWGDDDAVRVQRMALNADLEALAKIYAERARYAVELGEQSRHAAGYLFMLGLSILLLAGLSVYVLKTLVILPLLDITKATDGIAAGNLALRIPYIGRKDEIGCLAYAVQNFRDAAQRNVELQELEIRTAKARDAAIGQRDRSDDRYHSTKWQLSAAVNNMTQGLVMLDSTANVVLMNEQYRQIYHLPSDLKAGCSLKEVLDCRAKNGLLKEDVTEHLASIFKLMAKRETSHHEVELADGRFIRINSRPMDGGGWISTHEDFTEERRMQRVLERTERFLVTVIENVPEAIAAKDARSLRYVFVNRAAEKLFDRPRAEIMGKTARELFSEELAEVIEQGDKRLLDEGEQLEPMVHAVDTPNGRRLRAVRRIRIRGPDGESRVFLSMIEDRTDWAREPAGKVITMTG
jgi:PAS domain S-box-containing protein